MEEEGKMDAKSTSRLFCIISSLRVDSRMQVNSINAYVVACAAVMRQETVLSKLATFPYIHRVEKNPMNFYVHNLCWQIN